MAFSDEASAALETTTKGTKNLPQGMEQEGLCPGKLMFPSFTSGPEAIDFDKKKGI